MTFPGCRSRCQESNNQAEAAFLSFLGGLLTVVASSSGKGTIYTSIYIGLYKEVVHKFRPGIVRKFF